MTSTTNSSIKDAPHNPKRYTGYKLIFNPFTAMIFLFGLPYVISWYFMNGGDPVAFEAPNNNGQLVSPVIALGDYSLVNSDGTKISQTDLAGNWLLFTVTSACKVACQETLFTIRQARASMAVNRKVIKPIVLIKTPEALSKLPVDLGHEFPQLVIAHTQSVSTEHLLNIFSSVTPEVENSIFMVDPYGNLMMVYPTGSDQRGLMDDLKRLFKVNKPNV